ncbi:uncharacterized protein TEOVI_000775000 [Trypanosoma equiperdum]|uniref:Uncharacterized protein n=2 Tax=Trypanozoon TaxID=39700 RepID=Q57ZG4_TRYB2|nr:hypothetical protein, conserved [Trypanosoma brucei brucei TREU927]AAX79517.1 hypothetical protein, conserved [Trypanosoma brucei]AAZ12589.1 hypothetical protein, conserved [Trypanosoma brucei brucei TREU927]SCU66893.1 hypothetical protein, conserved [Trypanosoma equiperdum]
MGHCCATQTKQARLLPSNNASLNAPAEVPGGSLAAQTRPSDGQINAPTGGASHGVAAESASSKFTVSPVIGDQSDYTTTIGLERLVPVNRKSGSQLPVNAHLRLGSDNRADSVCVFDNGDDDGRFLTARSPLLLSSMTTPRVKFVSGTPGTFDTNGGAPPSGRGFQSCLSSQWDESVGSNKLNSCHSMVMNESVNNSVEAYFGSLTACVPPTEVPPSMLPLVSITASSSSSTVSSPFSSLAVHRREPSSLFVNDKSPVQSLGVSSFVTALSPSVSPRPLHNEAPPQSHADALGAPTATSVSHSRGDLSLGTAIAPSRATSPSCYMENASFATALSLSESLQASHSVLSSVSFPGVGVQSAAALIPHSRGTSSFASAVSPSAAVTTARSARTTPSFVVTILPSEATTTPRMAFKSARSSNKIGSTTVTGGDLMSCRSLSEISTSLSDKIHNMSGEVARSASEAPQRLVVRKRVTSLTNISSSSYSRLTEKERASTQEGVTNSPLIMAESLPDQTNGVVISLSPPEDHSSIFGGNGGGGSREVSFVSSSPKAEGMWVQSGKHGKKKAGTVLSFFTPDPAVTQLSEHAANTSLTSHMLTRQKPKMLSYFGRHSDPPFSSVNTLRQRNVMARSVGAVGGLGTLDASYKKVLGDTQKLFSSLPALPTYTKRDHIPRRRVFDLGTPGSASKSRKSPSPEGSQMISQMSSSINGHAASGVSSPDSKHKEDGKAHCQS